MRTSKKVKNKLPPFDAPTVPSDSDSTIPSSVTSITFAWQLANQGQYEALAELAQQQPMGINLNAAPSDGHSAKGITVAWLLANGGEHGLLAKLVQQQPTSVNWNAAPCADNHPEKGVTVAWILALDTAVNLLAELVRHQATNVNLNAEPSIDSHIDKGITVAWLLAHGGQYELLAKFVQQQPTVNININTKPSPDYHVAEGITLAWLLANGEQYELLAKLTQQQPVNLNATPTGIKDKDKGMTLAWKLAYDGKYQMLEEWVTQHSGVTNINAAPSLTGHAHKNVTLKDLLTNSKRFELLNKIMDANKCKNRGAAATNRKQREYEKVEIARIKPVSYLTSTTLLDQPNEDKDKDNKRSSQKHKSMKRNYSNPPPRKKRQARKKNRKATRSNGRKTVKKDRLTKQPSPSSRYDTRAAYAYEPITATVAGTSSRPAAASTSATTTSTTSTTSVYSSAGPDDIRQLSTQIISSTEPLKVADLPESKTQPSNTLKLYADRIRTLLGTNNKLDLFFFYSLLFNIGMLLEIKKKDDPCDSDELRLLRNYVFNGFYALNTKNAIKIADSLVRTIGDNAYSINLTKLKLSDHDLTTLPLQSRINSILADGDIETHKNAMYYALFILKHVDDKFSMKDAPAFAENQLIVDASKMAWIILGKCLRKITKEYQVDASAQLEMGTLRKLITYMQKNRLYSNELRHESDTIEFERGFSWVNERVSAFELLAKIRGACEKLPPRIWLQKQPNAADAQQSDVPDNDTPNTVTKKTGDVINSAHYQSSLFPAGKGKPKGKEAAISAAARGSNQTATKSGKMASPFQF